MLFTGIPSASEQKALSNVTGGSLTILGEDMRQETKI